MNDTRMHVCRAELRRRFETGMLTTLTGVLILVLLTLMMFFAVRVGIFDQRVSANDLRQKRAFHTAESGIQHAKEYLRANSPLVAASFALPNGTPGWLTAGAERWQKCSEASLGTDYSHPCFAEGNTARRADLYYWSFNGSTLLPLNTGGFLPAADESVEVQALLCVLDVDYELEIPVKGCSTDTTLVDGSRYFVTLMSRGQVECDGGDCGAEATLREAVANFGATAGGQAPAIPLTTKNTFPPTGAAEVVANPNGGGVGVPTSVWMNQNPACSADGSVISPSQGSWATCELHEWYQTESIPAGIACPGSCSCAVHEAISYTHGSDDILGIDLILDDEFPCDLFQSFFGYPRTHYEIIKSFATVLSDCSTLGPNSFGVYWISGSECRIQANVTIGSPQAPVLLISAAGVTRMAGGAVVFGVLYIADVEVATASFESLGTNIVYGQVVLDGQFGSYQGTFQVVYNEDTILRANGSGELGNLIGGWADFHAAWQ